MKGYPLIHSRTKYIDYNSNFFLRPEDLEISDVQNKILTATKNIDQINGIRYLCFKTPKYIVFGIVGVIQKIVEISTISEEQKQRVLSASTDEMGRKTFNFLGYCIKQDTGVEQEQIPQVEINDFLQLYDKYVVSNWEQHGVSYTTNKAELEELSVINFSERFEQPVLEKLGKKFYISNQESDKRLWQNYLAQLIHDVTFNESCCTNIVMYKELLNPTYSACSTTPNNIERLKQEEQHQNSLENEHVEKSDIESIFQAPKPLPIEQNEPVIQAEDVLESGKEAGKKQNRLKLIVIAIITGTVAIVVLLLSMIL